MVEEKPKELDLAEKIYALTVDREDTGLKSVEKDQVAVVTLVDNAEEEICEMDIEGALAEMVIE